MQALQRRADLLEVDVDRAVWSRGGRPLAGRAMRFGFAALFLGLALLIPDLTTRMVFAVTGVLALLFIGPLMDNRLEAIGRSVATADRRSASRLLVGLDKLRVVKLFASHGWVALQRGRLNLVLGNGRAAAKSFSDCARVIGQPELPALISAQAHGLMLAGDRKEARPLLQQLEKRDQLGPRDRIDLGLALLEDAGRAPLARAQLEAAREQLGGHPRVLAGLALAHARTDDGPGGLALLEAAEQADGVDDDEIATELVKRARKALRPVIEAAEKRQRKARVAAQAPAAARPTETAARAAKKDRRERREKKREKKRGGSGTVETSASEPIALAPTPVAARETPSEAELADETTLPVVRSPEPQSRRMRDDEAQRRAQAEADAAEQRVHAEAEQAERVAKAKADADRRAAEAEAAAAKQRAEDEAAQQRAEAEADAAATKQRAAAEAEAARQAAELDAAKQRALAEAEAQRLAAEAEAVQRAAEADAARWEAEAEKQRAAVAAAKQRAEEEAAKKRAEDEAAKKRAEDEAAKQAARVAAAAAPVPTFLPPPMPEVAAPSVVAPPVVRAPSLAPSKPADAPAVDASGWDDLLGDGPSKS